jgi:hypothetical protein
VKISGKTLKPKGTFIHPSTTPGGGDAREAWRRDRPSLPRGVRGSRFFSAEITVRHYIDSIGTGGKGFGGGESIGGKMTFDERPGKPDRLTEKIASVEGRLDREIRK